MSGENKEAADMFLLEKSIHCECLFRSVVSSEFGAIQDGKSDACSVNRFAHAKLFTSKKSLDSLFFFFFWVALFLEL